MILHQGTVRWNVIRQKDGTITYAITGSRDLSVEKVLARSTVRSGREGLRSVATAVGAFIMGLRSQV